MSTLPKMMTGNPVASAPVVTAPTPTRMGGALANGPLKGYTGPMPGTPEFKAARAAGGTPIRDYVQANRPAPLARHAMPGPMGPRSGPMAPNPNTGVVPPHMRTGFTPANPTAPTAPRPMMAEGGLVKAKSKLANGSKFLKRTGCNTKAGH